MDTCRHCGDGIIQRDNGSWVHVHNLNRCQTLLGRPYGYDAMPPAEGKCNCWACERFGQIDE